MDKREFAKRMREGKSVDLYGNVVCSLDMWEKIASIIEEQYDEIERLLNMILKIDREQGKRIEELLKENERLNREVNK